MRLLISTAPPDKAADLARQLVEERLVACVNILPGARSIYRWQGKICDDAEAVLLLKTEQARVAELTARLVELHPYDVPELVSLELVAGEGNPAYLEWVRDCVAGPNQS
ncbi:MAG: divalent-cation tolerance protein CutA [Deltaproteobacteria bacterium]|nr:divalent-cation tolerance protein CutA [Deltaproteobacteria bacterium]